jgi:hypothetical protein
VTAGWVEKLQSAAGSARGRHGDAVLQPRHHLLPPRPLVENTVPAGYTVDSFAALVERVATRAYPRPPPGRLLPYLRRQMLARVGPASTRRFGLGCGEETDLCMRG